MTERWNIFQRPIGWEHFGRCPKNYATWNVPFPTTIMFSFVLFRWTVRLWRCRCSGSRTSTWNDRPTPSCWTPTSAWRCAVFCCCFFVFFLSSEHHLRSHTLVATSRFCGADDRTWRWACRAPTRSTPAASAGTSTTTSRTTCACPADKSASQRPTLATAGG